MIQPIGKVKCLFEFVDPIRKVGVVNGNLRLLSVLEIGPLVRSMRLARRPTRGVQAGSPPE